MSQSPRGPVRRTIVTTIWTVAVLAMFTPAASAYIDPASTGMLFSAIVAGLAAAGTAVTMFWSRIVGLFRRGGAPDRDPE